jgi:Chaperone for flagella basal body P-ring formation
MVRLAILLGMLSLAFAPVGGAAGRISLVAEASVAGDAIVLADLLPGGAMAGRVRGVARGVELGSTPQLGTPRRLRGVAVAEAIEQSGLGVDEFAIPDVIVVQRAGRPLDGAEILATIQAAVEEFSLSSGGEAAVLAMRPEEMLWDTALRVAPGDAGLQVREMFVDLATRRASFRLVTNSGAGVEFAVLGRIAAKASRLREISQSSVQISGGAKLLRFAGPKRDRNASESAAIAGKAGVSDEFLNLPVAITAGGLAQIWLHSENSSIVMQVKALQAGRIGETIRVRLPQSGRTMRAVVTGPAALEAIF